MNMLDLSKELKGNAYPGRGIVTGRSADGTKAVAVCFIMGRSRSSRNRVSVEGGKGIHIQVFDEVKLSDPSLVIYAPIRVLGNKTIATSGDLPDAIYEGMDGQLTFEQSLRSRELKPDVPNYTPRIFGIIHPENGKFYYAMSILKDDNGNGDTCGRYTFAYGIPVAGEGHFIYTYMRDRDPLPNFEGESKLTDIPDAISEFMVLLWENLSEENKVSLFVQFTDTEGGIYRTRVMSKN